MEAVVSDCDDARWFVVRGTTNRYLGAYEWVRTEDRAAHFVSLAAAEEAAKTARASNSGVTVVRATGPAVPLLPDNRDARHPWDEEWRADDGDLLCAEKSDDCHITQTWHPYGSEERIGARAILAAAAPDLVRALLAVEWGVYCGSWDGPVCPMCVGDRSDGHAGDCQLDAALRKAGVR
jgi:hypothetical protein